jgi:hypothetical protein
MPRAKTSEALSPMDRRVLYFLTDLAEKEQVRTVQVFIDDIAQSIGASSRAVNHSLAALIRGGYVLREWQKTKRGSFDASKFTILNPDRERMDKIRAAAEYSGIPLRDMVEYVYWLNFHQHKLRQELYPTLGFIAKIAHCPGERVADFVKGLHRAGILVSDREVRF